MIRLPALGRPLFRCRLCGWVGTVDPQLPAEQPSFYPASGTLGLPEWAIHYCEGAERIGIADLVGCEARVADGT